MNLKRPIALVAAPVLAAAVWLFFPGAKVRVDIPSGLSAFQTAHLLKREGVIRSVLVFKVTAKLCGVERSLKPGRYTLRRGLWLGTLLKRLRRGDTEQIKVVIPEGFMARQIADRLEAAGVTPAAEFRAYVEKNNLEGYLFPTTYFFPQALGAETVAHTMHMEFDKRVVPEFEKTKPDRFTLHQMVTLASIVQREAYSAGEMPMIAAVYRNRIKQRMRLNADPTVQYAWVRATGRWKKELSFKDLEILSPYNTYSHFGFPPGPICSPGMTAFRAALHPADTDALYFVGDSTGRLIFNKTFQEHWRSKQKAKRERALEPR